MNSLYRFYDETATLLYVGRTVNSARRFSEHARVKSWWPEVVTIKIENLSSAEELAAAEQRVIEAEYPLYNVTHNPIDSFSCGLCQHVIERWAIHVLACDDNVFCLDCWTYRFAEAHKAGWPDCPFSGEIYGEIYCDHSGQILCDLTGLHRLLDQGGWARLHESYEAAT